MTRAEIIAIQKDHEMPGAWQEFAENPVEIRTPYVALTLRGSIDMRISSSGGHISIAYGEFMDQVVTLTNERMSVEAGRPR